MYLAHFFGRWTIKDSRVQKASSKDCHLWQNSGTNWFTPSKLFCTLSRHWVKHAMSQNITVTHGEKSRNYAIVQIVPITQLDTDGAKNAVWNN